MKALLSFRSNIYSNFSVVLLCLVIFTIGTKLSVSYFDISHKLIVPERHFASATLGRDIADFTVRPVYEIRNGTVPFIFGYGSVSIADLIIHPLEYMHVCSSHSQRSCEYVLYIGMVIASILGFLGFILYISKDQESRIDMLLIFSLFLLGVPYAKAIEAGNLDLLLAVIYGWSMYIVITFLGIKMRKSHSILLGVFLGILLSTKAFFILFIGIALFYRSSDLYVIGSFIVSFAFTSLWPRIYGVPAGVFDVFSFAMRGSDAFGPQLYTQVNYGNNAIFSYISNLLQIVDTGRVSLPLHIALTHVLALLICWIVYVRPLLTQDGIRIFVSAWFQKKFGKYRIFYTKEFALLLFTYASVAMILVPAWSYDYRLLYMIPVIFILFQSVKAKQTKELLYWSIIMLAFKSV